MKQVIRIGGEPKTEKVLKPIKLTNYLSGREGWKNTDLFKKCEWEKIVYLGRCDADGDLFAAYEDGMIRIFRGHLNDGVY